MLDPWICPACGEWDLPRLCGDELNCTTCGVPRAFRRLPLLCLTGASGSGKSTAAALAATALAQHVVALEQDVLWRAELAEQPGGIIDFRATWMRLAAMIGQSGRPVLLCGTVVPAEIEPQPERILFDSVHYLALHASPGVLADRLRRRPPWRGWDEARITEMLAFAAHLQAHSPSMNPPVRLLDTNGRDPDAVAGDVVGWVREVLARLGPARSGIRDG